MILGHLSIQNKRMTLKDTVFMLFSCRNTDREWVHQGENSYFIPKHMLTNRPYRVDIDALSEK